MPCGCILRKDNKKSLITIREINPVTRGNKKLHIDYICKKHLMEISTLTQWIIFGSIKMNFCTFIINTLFIDNNNNGVKSAEAIAESLKSNNSINSINLRKLY